ncbi:diguanylate cyclase [Aliikangiella marina]|uniref:diguanylate cyclase n=1 Tax=Aliikangiella marina TaxID=1712262 RepID=A0A545T485_9GAMM|nr:diguanylate cyclase [Aliikangiella marina]TQV71977.1 diguanylate cyclase [Aliikangiella marina]TQV72030.1 diguanylate cyclase [Aliikangiella marina]
MRLSSSTVNLCLSGLFLVICSVQAIATESIEKGSSEPITDVSSQLAQIKQLINHDPASARQQIDDLRDNFGDSVSNENLVLFGLDCEQNIVLGHAQEAKDVASLGLKRFASLELSPSYGELIVCYGNALEFLGDIKTASKYYNQGIQIAEMLDSAKLATYAYRARGDLNAYHGTVESALADLHKAYQVAETNNDTFNLGLAKNSLANLYVYIKDYQKALDIYLEIQESASQSNNLLNLATTTYNIARVYQDLGEIEQAASYFNQSYQVSEKIGDDAGVAFALKGLGIIDLNRQQIESAKRQLEKATDIFRSLGEVIQIAQVKIHLGKVYYELGDVDKSIATYRSAILLFEEKESLQNLKKAFESLSRTYAAIGDFEQAYQAQNKYIEYFKLHQQEDRERRITEMRVAFDTERKEHENKLLVEKNRFTTLELEKKSQLARFQYWVLVLGALLVLSLLLLIWRYIRNRKVLEKLARTDELTLLANRRHIMEFVEKEFIRVERGGSTLSLVMFDIDHFKQFNDKYGHKVGDRVLQSVAKQCLPLLRKSDILGRIGGEEFLLFLPNTSENEAYAIAERCRIAVSEIPTPLIGDEEKITISSGLVTYHSYMSTVDDMLNKADMALYQAKKQGRNKTCIAE